MFKGDKRAQGKFRKTKSSKVYWFLGWGGADEKFTIAKELKELPMKITNSPLCGCNKVCVESLKKNIGHNICNGDSGGPFTCQVPGKYKWEFQDIVSHSLSEEDTCDPNSETATVFTSVYPMKNWIKAQMNNIYESEVPK